MANDPFEYDVALSFAGEDRGLAEKFAGLLRAKDISVLLAEYDPARPSSSDVLAQIAETYCTKAWCCVMLISRHYPLKKWTESERTSVREHTLRDADEYILPVRLDDTDVPGITETRGYRDLRQHSMESIVDLLEGKLKETKSRSGPPSKSHDLRSGNVPSGHDKQGAG